jgi:hypothetical protein
MRDFFQVFGKLPVRRERKGQKLAERDDLLAGSTVDQLKSDNPAIVRLAHDGTIYQTLPKLWDENVRTVKRTES